ncbi:MAG: (Fe-S)-binding protein [Candidatus Pacearchaeota archaeon]
MGIISWLAGKNNLYYPGCLTKFILPEKLANYREILNLLGVDFIMLKEEICCGSPILNAGYRKDFRDVALKNFELFKKKNIGKIITNCPACFKTFNQEYKKFIPEWNIPAEHFTLTIFNMLKKKSKLIKKLANEKIIYHDPCHLGRYNKIYEEPREVLRLLGYQVMELPLNRENSLCCGGGGGLKANNPELSNKIAKKIFEYVKGSGVSKIISTCPMCFSQFKENFQGIEVLEFSDVVLNALKKDK